MEDARYQAAAWAQVSRAAASEGTGVSLGIACRACAEDLEADALGITLVTAGELRLTACATDERAERLEDVQLVTGEGPCTDAFVQGSYVEADLLAAPARWPAFAEAAAEVGIRTVAALVLSLGDLRLGAVDFYRSGPRPFTDEQRGRARAFARVLTLLALDQHPHLLTTETHPTRPGPQGYPPVVHQAAGILAAQNGLAVDDALARLRAHSYSHNQPLLVTAQHVIVGGGLDPGPGDGAE